METNKILITGAAGFIGFSLIKQLLTLPFDIVGIDNINDYYDVNLKYARLAHLGINARSAHEGEELVSAVSARFSFIKLDITDTQTIGELFAKHQFTIVVNLAAQAGVRYSIDHPKPYIDTNIVGFFNLINASHIASVKHFIYASSSSVYGLDNNFPYRESDQVDTPVSLYGATKKCDELIAHSYSHIFGMRTTGVRFFTVYGPFGRPDMAPIKFMKAILNHQPIEVYNQGHMLRDFTYIDDIVRGLILMISSLESPSGTPYSIYNIGNSSPVPLLQFISEMEETVGEVAEKHLLAMQDGDVCRTYADVTRLQHDFHFVPTTKLHEGLYQLFRWYRAYYQA